jgi:ribonuclease HII
MSARVVLAGIDEAGLGPLLGSLALGYAWLEAPGGEVELWRRLRPTVSKTPSKRARLVVGDSKIVFQRTARGARRLEETVLSFHGEARGEDVATAREFLFGAPGPAAEFAALPWGEELPVLPADCERESLELSRAMLARALAKAEVSVLGCGVRLVPAAELNASYAETHNKADTVWERVAELLRRAWELRARGEVRATVDMLGGRRRYGSRLARALPEASVSLVEESEGRSAYRLAARDGGHGMELEFRVKGETHSFAVALASCCAKYARELEMRAFNAFFARWQPELTPTAGYREDGNRWLKEAALALERSGVARGVVVRER